MPTVVGVKLPYAGKTLYFDPVGVTVDEGDHVIVSTERGQEFGEVVLAPREIQPDEVPGELKPVLRVADEADHEKVAGYASAQRAEMETFRRLVHKHGLDMKPIGVEHLFDDSKMVFYFVAEERVDFRELVRDLASEFHTRIDMRQVGVRDEARMVGGLGHCGQQLCCARFGGEFQPVSIRMAKEQDLPLNPLKISGLCGRLMCCLRYEYETYKEFKTRAPKRGTPVETPSGDGKVVGLDTPRESVSIRLQDGTELTVPLEALDCSAGRGCPCKLKADALQPEEAALVGTAPPAEAEPVREQKPTPADGEPKKRRSRRSRRRKPAESGQEQQKQSEPKPRQKQGGGEKRAEGSQQPASAPGRRRRRRRKPSGGQQEAGDK
ncbi:MAG: stage 0 sporulation family protein [Anaerosomatales bacterium]|nr:stage 0 sporulation family protein [Anaerosomatales bacterium]